MDKRMDMAFIDQVNMNMKAIELMKKKRERERGKKRIGMEEF